MKNNQVLRVANVLDAVPCKLRHKLSLSGDSSLYDTILPVLTVKVASRATDSLQLHRSRDAPVFQNEQVTANDQTENLQITLECLVTVLDKTSLYPDSKSGNLEETSCVQFTLNFGI